MSKLKNKKGELTDGRIELLDIYHFFDSIGPSPYTQSAKYSFLLSRKDSDMSCAIHIEVEDTCHLWHIHSILGRMV